jgi:hypothetical protein
LPQFKTEGNNPFENNGDKTPSDSTPEINEDGTPKADAGKKDEDPNLPFHQHPRWLERETEWKTRFNDSEARHQEDLRKIREEISSKQPTKEKSESKIPVWFGGTQEQWEAYEEHQNSIIENAKKGAIEEFTKLNSTEKRAVDEATQFMQTEISAIESDKELNPTGAKIDPNKLLKFVLDNDLVDSKGRWNYRKGFQFMPKDTPKTSDRKPIVGATNSGSGDDPKPSDIATPETFKHSRPW